MQQWFYWLIILCLNLMTFFSNFVNIATKSKSRQWQARQDATNWWILDWFCLSYGWRMPGLGTWKCQNAAVGKSKNNSDYNSPKHFITKNALEICLHCLICWRTRWKELISGPCTWNIFTRAFMNTVLCTLLSLLKL